MVLATAVLVTACPPSTGGGTGGGTGDTTTTTTTTTAPPDTPLHETGAVLPAVGVPVQVAPGAPAAPAGVDLRSWAVPIGNQGSLGSCVPWAIQYAMLGWYSNKQPHPGQPFAPMYAYSQIRQPGGGSSPADALTLAKDQGTATLAAYQPQGNYNASTLPTAAQRANAALHKIKGFHSLYADPSGTGGAATLASAIRTSLAASTPVAITIGVTPGFDNASASSAAAITDGTGTIRGYHEVLALGYDSAGLIIQNSWGADWAGDGFARLGWSFVQGRVFAADVVDGGFADAPTPPTPTPPPAPTQVGPGMGSLFEHNTDTVDLVANVPANADSFRIVVTSAEGNAFSVGGNNEWRAVTAADRANGFHLTFPASGLPNGTYWWAAQARNSAGESPTSIGASFGIWTAPDPYASVESYSDGAGRVMEVARRADINHLGVRIVGESGWSDLGGEFLGGSFNATHLAGHVQNGRRLVVAIGEDRILRAKWWNGAWDNDWHRPADGLAMKLDSQDVQIIQRSDGGLNIYANRLADSRRVRISENGTGVSTSWTVTLV